MNRTFFILICAGSAALSGCVPSLRKQAATPPGKHLAIGARETAELTDREYLMRKATLGSRTERIEALDVIERSNDPDLYAFLSERLKKEDDRFIQIRIMQALGKVGDVRAVPTLRSIARWDTTRVGCEAIAALYELGDDSMMPRLIERLRPDEDNPEMPGIAHRVLERMTGADLPPTVRAWTSYYNSHRLAPYQAASWYWPMRAPLPPTQPGTTLVLPRPKAGGLLPTEELKIRRTSVTWRDFWRTEAP